MLQAKQAHRLAPYGELTLRQLFLSLFNSLLLPLCLSISAFSSVCIVGQLDFFTRRNLPGTWRGGKGGYIWWKTCVRFQGLYCYSPIRKCVWCLVFSSCHNVQYFLSISQQSQLWDWWTIRPHLKFLCRLEASERYVARWTRIQCSCLLPPRILQCCNTIQFLPPRILQSADLSEMKSVAVSVCSPPGGTASALGASLVNQVSKVDC